MKRILFVYVSVFIFAGCTGNFFKDGDEPVYREKNWNPVIEKFSSCGEIDSYLEAYRRQDMSTIGSPMPESSEGDSQDQTYQDQVEGVFEGDVLQVTPSYFFFARLGAIEIVAKKPLALYKTISTPASFMRRLVSYGDKLIYVGSDYSQTTVQIFDTKSDFRKIYENNFSGTTLDLRLVEGKLRIVTRSYFPSVRGSVECSQIYRPNVEDGDGMVTFVHQLNLEVQAFSTETTGFLGGADFIHMTSDELLLFKNGYSLPSHFRVVKLGAGKPQFEQVQTYPGTIKDRWSVLVKNGAILFAATMANNGSENKIFHFEKMRGLQYELASESQGFGDGETIRAVRYFMDKAYVVTYRQTDPLFIFDIKDPAHIKLLGSLESPGFSTQLRELSDGILFGLGVTDDQRRFKVSLFDVLDPASPRETQALICCESNGYALATSEALREPKALFISQEKDRIIFPALLTEIVDPSVSWTWSVQFSGILILDYRGKQVQEVGRITHKPMRDPQCDNRIDIQRAFETQGEIYSFSSFGVMKSSAANFSTLDQVPFRTSQADCEKY